jgi:hypothetical protein
MMILVCAVAAASAQPRPTGHVSVFADYVPNRADTVEARVRLFAEELVEVSPQLRIVASGFAEGLLARRPVTGVDERSPVRDAVIRVQDAYLDWTAARLDLRAGFARVAWGRLDEIQPTDVINPIDVSRFFFEGRSEARLPVALIRARLFLSEATTLEGVYVPVFRRGRFDQLEERSSPFSIGLTGSDDGVVCLAIGCPTLPPAVIERDPALRAGNAQGGVRLTSTSGRLDWSVSLYSGLEPFPIYEARPLAGADGRLVIAGMHPRFTLIGADFETVRGAWGLRGEVAGFLRDTFQSPAPAAREGSSLQAGAGVDRKAGNYRISGTVVFHRERYDDSAGDPERGRSDLTVVISADRAFRRDRYQLRTFGVLNPSESSGFVRTIGTAVLRDNLALESSLGWFIGDGEDAIGRFSDSDFLYLRVRYYF